MIAHREKKFFGCEDAFFLTDFTAFILNTNVAPVACVEHELQCLYVVGLGLVSLRVEVVALGADTLGKGHELLDSHISIVASEVAEVGQRPAIWQANVLENLGEPLAI